MKNKIKGMLVTNMALKIGAFFLAFLLWMAISNIQDSVRTKNIKIDITYINEDLLEKDGITVIFKPASITIPVEVKRSKADKVTSKNFKATADLTVRKGSDLNAQQVMVKVDLVDPEDNTVVGWDYPRDGRWISVKMDELQTKKMKVQLVQTGALSNTYKLTGDGLVVQPERITVTGPKSEFSKLTAVKAQVDLTQLTPENNQIISPIALYDANDSPIESENLVLSQSEVKISAGVLRIREVGINFSGVMGEPAAGYGYSEMSCDTDTVVLEGLKASLADVNSITIPKEELDITGATQTVVKTIDITPYLPADTSLSNRSSTITVTLYIEKLKEKSYRIQTEKVECRGKMEGYFYTVGSGTVGITLKGFQEDLNSLQEDQIKLSVDVSELGPGTYTRAVAVEVKPGFTLVNNPTLTVEISDSPPSEEESSTDEDSLGIEPGESSSGAQPSQGESSNSSGSQSAPPEDSSSGTQPIQSETDASASKDSSDTQESSHVMESSQIQKSTKEHTVELSRSAETTTAVQK